MGKEEKSGIILDRLKTFAKEKQEDGKYKFIQFVDSNFKTPDDIDSVQYYYKQEGGSFWLYREKTPEEIEEDNAKDEQTAKNEQNKRLREELSKRAFEQRCEFVKVAYAGKNRADDIMRFAFGSIIRNQAKWERITNEKFCIAAGIDTDNTQVLNEIRTGEYDITCTRALMVCAYCNYHDSKSNTYFDYYGSYKENEELDELYDFFESIGYKMSDEERAFRDGTHELFKTE